MPYIQPDERPCLVPRTHSTPLDPGSLNFAITTLVLNYIADRGKRYATLNEAVGVLECAKLEFYRRAVAAYEDEKCKLNGDVYP
jgi:hypothetical protein